MWSLDPGAWGIVDADWNERDSADVLVRPYARRVAGVPSSMGFDPETRVFHLEWRDRDGVTGPTDLYVPATRHYPDGWELTVDDSDGSGLLEWDATREVASITVRPRDGIHRIEIRPSP